MGGAALTERRRDHLGLLVRAQGMLRHRPRELASAAPTPQPAGLEVREDQVVHAVLEHGLAAPRGEGLVGDARHGGDAEVVAALVAVRRLVGGEEVEADAVGRLPRLQAAAGVVVLGWEVHGEGGRDQRGSHSIALALPGHALAPQAAVLLGLAIAGRVGGLGAGGARPAARLGRGALVRRRVGLAEGAVGVRGARLRRGGAGRIEQGQGGRRCRPTRAEQQGQRREAGLRHPAGTTLPPRTLPPRPRTSHGRRS